MNERDEFLIKILATFRIEAEEGIQKITSNIIELEKATSPARSMELIEATFREAHSLKGASRAVNMTEVESLCQAMESLFSALKNKEIEVVIQIFDLLHEAVNFLQILISTPKDEVSIELKDNIFELIVLILNAAKNKQKVVEVPELKKELSEKHEIVEKAEPEIVAEKKPLVKNKPEPKIEKQENVQTIRISSDKIEKLLFSAEELLSVKLSSGYFTDSLYTITQKLNNLQNDFLEINTTINYFKQNIELAAEQKIHTKEELLLGKLTDFFDISGKQLKAAHTELKELKKLSTQSNYETNQKIDLLIEEVKDIISVPFSTILDGFPKNARELAKSLEKEVELEIIGANIEIDRRILEEIRNPMIHLLRNSIDHGIEKPQIRKQFNKTEKAKITFKIKRLEDNKIEIVFSDDGAGIDLVKLKEKYIKNEGILPEKISEITEKDLLDYVFKSGISTSAILTDLSGRGLGLAIVSEKIKLLGGTISVKSFAGNGTEFKLQIPLSAETIRCVRLIAGNQEFVIATDKISRVLKLKKAEVKSFGNKDGVIIGEKVLHLAYLRKLLNLNSSVSENDFLHIIVIGYDNKQMGIVVDKIIGEEEMLIKRFNKHILHIKNISGATILGSGKLVPVLNTSDLFDAAVEHGISGISNNMDTKEKISQSILIVEDSITSRMLLKNILETAGYKVNAAVDGIDGYTKLKEGKFDLVISDVDMPRMNGFDFTSKLRADKEYAEIPVILVTSLSSNQDREHGMEVGANAYIVKSNFDQGNLLNLIERLI